MALVAGLAVFVGLPLAGAAAGTSSHATKHHGYLLNAPGRAHVLLTPKASRIFASHYPRHYSVGSKQPLDATTNMTYHGGSVMRNVTAYAIFWSPTTLPASYPGAPFDSNYRSIVDRYFNDIGTTPYFNILTQFGDNSGNAVPNATTFGGDWVDTTTFPHAGTNADPLDDGNIRDSIDRAIAANPTWQGPSNSTMYFVYTPKNVIECSDSSSCFAATDYLGNGGSNGKFCALPLEQRQQDLRLHPLRLDR